MTTRTLVPLESPALVRTDMLLPVPEIASRSVDLYQRRPMQISGQWIGEFSGPVRGWATLSIEPDMPNRAFACVVQGDDIPRTRVDFDIAIRGGHFTAKSTGTRVFDPERNALVPAEDFQKRHGNEVLVYRTVEAAGKISRKAMVGHWKADGSPSYAFRLNNPMARQASKPDHPMTWRKFKGFVSRLVANNRRLLFRGQSSNRWRLRTSLHRHGRYDLLRYNHEALSDLTHHINAMSQHRYNLDESWDFSAFLSLAQHHGFPTPILDWSRSPFVAAYFAFEAAKPSRKQPSCVRVFCYDGNAWRRKMAQVDRISDPVPSITVSEFPAFNNLRHVPQQSVHAFSTVEDVEAWIRLFEGPRERFLTIIDIPSAEREVVMRDLESMGITHASLFPGLDGVCRAVRERHFG